MVAHAVTKEAVQGGAPRLRAQQHAAIWQHHALQQLHVVPPRPVTHIHWATTHLPEEGQLSYVAFPASKDLSHVYHSDHIRLAPV